MPRLAFGTLTAAFLLSAGPAHTYSSQQIGINDNRSAAGTLKDGVLTLRLEVREGEWHPDRDADPGIIVHAFAEQGKAPLVPGPLVRVPEGTEIHAFVQNALADSTLIVYGLSTRGTTTDAEADTVQIKPGATREVRFVAGAPGTYFYMGRTAPARTNVRGPDPRLARAGIDAELGGAFIIDPRGASGPARDRVFVLSLWGKDRAPGEAPGPNDPILRYTINGKAWPNTERLTYSTGDSVRFRVMNVSNFAHPMHLHGFYFDVRSRGDESRDSTFAAAGSPHRVVTERVAPGRTATMTWVPERAGYWLFHCHDNLHALRNSPLDESRLPDVQTMHIVNHALEMMGGLTMGIEVRPSGPVTLTAEPRARRWLRLVARVDSTGAGTDDEPAYGYALHERNTTSLASRPLLPGPTIVLARGEPVSIMVVNELNEGTSVHWHGIELDSYYDGVSGFAGHPGRIAPVIAPRDSFEARFTPPRSGTFIYHPHADDIRQQKAGMSGVLVVVDSVAAFDSSTDIVLLISVPRHKVDFPTHVLLNGSLNPAPREMRVGQRYRLRIIDIHTYRPSMIVRVARDSTLLTWRAIAKDGMDLPADQATLRPATQQLGNGETYDFELIPAAAGLLHFAVTSQAGAMLVSLPIHVR
jgi:FtsP/CotA-like multicopper oxidase with cupredoxin domain